MTPSIPAAPYIILRFDPALPCGHPAPKQPNDLCGQPATIGMATNVEGGAWEVIPVCSAHMQDLLNPGTSRGGRKR